MRLYLVRHGEASHPEVDPERGLTELGRREVEKVASLLGKMKITVDAVWESGKKRATQTAEILASSIESEHGIERCSDLAPMDPVSPVADRLASLDSDMLIVGHLPFLSRLASRLILREEASEVVRFQESTTLCLKRDRSGRWTVEWMILPSLL